MTTPAVNLLPPELRRRAKRSRGTNSMLAALLVCAVLVAGYDIYVVRQTRDLEREASAKRVQVKTFQADADTLRRLQQEETALQQRQNRYEVLRGAEWSRLWQGVQSAMPAGVSLQTLTFGPGTASLAGSALGLPALALTEEQLAAVPGVSGVYLDNLKSEAGGRVTFAIHLSLASPYGAGGATAKPAGQTGNASATPERGVTP